MSWCDALALERRLLRAPASRLREVNRAIESTAWGGYLTEFDPTYDYKAQAQQMRATEGK